MPLGAVSGERLRPREERGEASPELARPPTTERWAVLAAGGAGNRGGIEPAPVVAPEGCRAVVHAVIRRPLPIG